MYRNILATVNEFTNSEISARYAIALARSCRAELTFLFVSKDALDANALRHAEAALGRLFSEAEASGVAARSVLESGDPVEKITGWVKNNEVDITFAGTRREDVERRFFVTALARELMLKLPCSVAMVRAVHLGKTHPRHILVPLGGRARDIEERTFFAAKLAEAFGSKVTLIHMPKPMSRFLHGEVRLKPAERDGLIPGDISEYVSTLNRYDVPHDKATAHGHVGRTINIEAAVRRNDLIVMGASQRSLLSRLVRGNPVEDVLRDTPCNLIVFRPGHEHT